MKRKLFMLCLAGMLLYTNPAFATPFPEKTNEVVQDKDNYLKKEDKASFTESLKDMPGTYKVVAVESTSPEAESPDAYAHNLYENFNLPEDALMVVLDMDTEQVGVYAGPELQKKGATMELLHDKLTSFYEPFRNQKKYLTGIQTFITEVNAELDRISTKPASADAAAADEQASGGEPKEKGSDPGGIPWWIYALGAVFALLAVSLVYAMFRRRSIFAQLDDVEDWKEELVEKINVIEVEKPLRRSSGMTEERYHQLADKKENLLRIRIPDVEIMILDAEEACDRFRFTLALGILDEAREMMTQIEQELADLKADTIKVAVTKQETKLVIPEIGKLVEQVERRLSDVRLEYGLSFHELKSTLDEVETMRSLIKTARASGDDVQAFEMTQKAQQLLEGMVHAMERIPSLVERVQKEMPEEFRQLEEGIDQAVRDGYDLNQDGLESSLLQAKQLLTAARNALEEGSLGMVDTHVKAFEVLIDTTYQGIEEAVLAQREAAAAAVLPTAPEVAGQPAHDAEKPDSRIGTGAEFPGLEQREFTDLAQEESAAQAPEANLGPAPDDVPAEKEERFAGANRLDAEEHTAAFDHVPAQDMLSRAERDVLLNGKAKTLPVQEEPAVEYELVIPKRPAEPEEIMQEEAPERLLIETEDDALDELERISSTLVRVRQQIKRSYLPGIPDQLKYMFEEVVQTLARIKTAMEQYRYDLNEVAILIQEADELLGETERMAERIISTCQLAEGAIQYTNRYRRQNRQVNELLTKAEQSFRQLAFAEAYQLAEEARLVVEGAPAESEARWLLRRKKKG